MRISSDRNSPDFNDCYAMCRVFLEGAERNNVISADEEGRTAVTTKLDEFGNPRHKDGQLLTDTFYGAVRIECPAWLRQEVETGVRVHGSTLGS